MPIKVKHEASMGALAQLALLAGMRPSEDIKVPTGGGGGGRGMRMTPTGRQGPLSDTGARRAIQLEEMQRAQRWETRRKEESEQQLREEAEAKEIEQQKWIKEFSPQTKQKIAKDNNAIGEIQTQIANGTLSSSRGGQMIDQIQKRQSSYRRTNRPRNSSDPPLFPEGQNIGESWEEGGATMTRDPDGKKRLLVRPDQTMQYMQQQGEMKRQSEIAAFRQKLVGMTRKEVSKAGDVTERPLDETERLEELEYAFPELRAQRLQQEQQERLRRQMRGRDEAINKMLEERDREMTGNVTLSGKPEPTFEEVPDDQIFIREPEDKDLPPRIGHAQSLVRHFVSKYKKEGATYLKVTDIPDEYRAAFMEAAEILERHAERK